jgi:uncharacterized protein YgiM (DUF1202 family)
VNLRSGPGTNYSVLATAPSTARGVVTGYPIVAGWYTWYPVSLNGYPAGYIAGQYLTTSGVATATRTASPTRTRTATGVVTVVSTVTRTPTASRTATGVTSVVSSPTRTATRTPTTISGGLAPGDMVRTTAYVNLRTGPGTNFTVIDVVHSGTSGVVTGNPVQANGFTWYPVAMNGYPAGYLAGNYLTKTGSGPTVTPTRTRTNTPATATRTATTISGGFQIGETIQVNTASLNLRSGPGTTSTSLGLMPRGTTGTVTGAPQQVGSVLWYPVDMNGFGAGWASGPYLTNVITSAVEPTETPAEEFVPTEPAVATAIPTLAPEVTATEVVVPPTEIPSPADVPAEDLPTEAAP